MTCGISIMAACMNREVHLRQALPSWLIQDQIRQIVLLDWSSDERLVDIIEPVDDRVIHVRVEGATSWYLTKAYNLAARVVNQPLLCKLDCDYVLAPGFFDFHPLQADSASFFCGDWRTARTDNESHTCGFLFVPTMHFLAVNGYNEYISTYGSDDIDLTRRLTLAGLKKKRLNCNLITHLEHSNASRGAVEDQLLHFRSWMNEYLSWHLDWSLNPRASDFKFNAVNESFFEARGDCRPLAIPEPLGREAEMHAWRTLASVATGQSLETIKQLAELDVLHIAAQSLGHGSELAHWTDLMRRIGQAPGLGD